MTRSAPTEKVGSPIDSQDAWAELVAWLPQMLSDLLASDVYGVDDRPPKGRRGVYLFTESGKHLYVGRTSITARSRASGRPPITSFRHRFDQHTQPGRPPTAATFAHGMMREAAREREVEVTPGWWERRPNDGGGVYRLFCEAKDRVRAMEFRVVAFDDDVRGVRSTVAEIYVHARLRTPFNDFSTS